MQFKKEYVACLNNEIQKIVVEKLLIIRTYKVTIKINCNANYIYRCAKKVKILVATM